MAPTVFFRCACVVYCLFRVLTPVALAQQGPVVDTPASYLIGAGDILDIEVRNEPEISRTVVVGPDGRVSLPLAQDILAAGRTAGQLETRLERSLSAFLLDPVVTVNVKSAVGLVSQQVRVVGEVITPTAIPFRAGLTLLDAIEGAGGLLPKAGGNRTKLVRRSGGTFEEIPVRLDDLVRRGDLSANLVLQPGDVLVVPQGFLSGELTIDRALAFEIAFSDNVDLDPDGEKESAFTFTSGPIFGVRADYARLTGALDAALAGQHISAGDDKGLRFDPGINGFGTAELVEELLFFDASASIRRQLLDTTKDEADSDEELVQVYGASPYITNRFGRFATSETRYRFTQVLVDGGDQEGDAENIQRHEGILSVDSGSRFSRFDWAFLASAFKEVGKDDGNAAEDDDAEGYEVDFGVEYPVSQSFTLLGAVGYERFEDGDTDIDGPTWRAGFRWRPSPRLDLETTYGRRDGDESFAGSMEYQLTPRTRAFASYRETVETEVDELAGELGAIGVDPDTGDLIDLETGLPFDPNATPTTVVDNTTRTKTLSAGLVSTIGLNRFQVTGGFEQEEDEATGGAREDAISVEGEWTRPLTTRLTSTILLVLEDNRAVTGDETEYQVTWAVAYRITDRFRGTLSYGFRAQDSDEDDDDFTENRFVLGLTGRF